MEKRDLTAIVVARLVAEQFPQWADLAVVPVALDGWDNTTFHNFFRGGRLDIYDVQARDAIERLADETERNAVTEVWEAALSTTWDRAPVWVHGDVAPSNLLVVDGRLHAVIDFGCAGVGDPACDLAMAWTFFSDETAGVFRAGLGLDAATLARGRGWALWKALITLPPEANTDAAVARLGLRSGPHKVIDCILSDHHRR